MANLVLYLKAEQNAEVMEEHVCVKDIASLYCADKSVCAKVKSLKIHQFHEKDNKRQVISILKVIQLIEKECPNVSVENIGENATLIELINVNKHKGPVQWLKMIFVAAISFFGTGFTIMAFHNGLFYRRVQYSGSVLFHWACSRHYPVLQPHWRPADHKRSNSHRSGNACI